MMKAKAFTENTRKNELRHYETKNNLNASIETISKPANAIQEAYNYGKFSPQSEL